MNGRAVAYVLTALGLLLVGLLFLALVSGIWQTTPRVNLPPPNLAPHPTRPAYPRATVEGLIEGSGPTVDPHESQGDRPSRP
ncbi:MAG: hypothetical protein KKA73_03910 [Chloroflexi bacterium]|nr:hypothetical protein [Chloroflexota bacterium]